MRAIFYTDFATCFSGQCGIGNDEGKDEKVEQDASNHLSSQDMYSDQRLSVSDPKHKQDKCHSLDLMKHSVCVSVYLQSLLPFCL